MAVASNHARLTWRESRRLPLPSLPAAIHVTPDTFGKGLIGKIRNGDLILIDAQAGLMQVDITDVAMKQRSDPGPGSEDSANGMGRELFDVFRRYANDTEAGGTVLRGLGSVTRSKMSV